MTEPQFTRQQTGTRIYYTLNMTGTPPGYTVAFVPAGPSSANPLSLSQSWASAGVYLLLRETPRDWERFFAAAERWLAETIAVDARFVWITNPNDPLDRWVVTRLKARAGAGPARTIAEAAQVRIGGYTVVIEGRSTVQLNASNDAFVIQRAAGSPVYVQADRGRTRLSSADTTITLPMSGALTGCILFSLPVRDATTARPVADLDALDVGFRFYTSDEYRPGFGAITSLRYVLFDLEGGALTLYASIDPANLLAPDRTRFNLLAPGAQTGSPISSYYRTNLGQVIQLTPTAHALSPAGPRLVFTRRAFTADLANIQDFSLTVEGSFIIGVKAPQRGASEPGAPIERFMCGVSGMEYLGLMVESGNLVHFFAGQPAYAPNFRLSTTALPDPNAAPRSAVALDATLTTAWAYVTPPSGQKIVYYAQPEASTFYRTQLQQGETPGFLRLMEVQAAALSAGPARAVAFPLLPYARLEGALTQDFFQFEVQVVSPTRRGMIPNLEAVAGQAGVPREPSVVATLSAPPPPPPPSQPSAGDKTGITPQGLIARFNNDTSNWKALVLAQTGNGAQQLQFSAIRGAFRAALQTNQLFIVIADREQFFRCASINYKLTAQSFADLKAFANPSIPDATLQQLRGAMLDKPWDDIDAYKTALNGAIGAGYTTYLNDLLKYGAFARLSIEQWTFDLSPYLWDQHHTILVFKYGAKSLEDLVADTTTWSWKEAAQLDNSVSATQQAILQIIADAKERARAGQTAFAHFADEVAGNPNWNGILFLRAFVPLTELPQELRGIAAGIDPSLFYAHHVGIDVAPITVASNGSVARADSALFGLIFYNNPEDQFATGQDYQFKVLSLTIQFQNSAIINFFSQIELMINRLFGEPSLLSDLQPNNNLVLSGVLQTLNGHSSYVFIQQAPKVYKLVSYVLDEVEITRAQFITMTSNVESGDIQTRFALTGNLRFKELPQFDIFSFGYRYQGDGAVDFAGQLRFSNLSIFMTFNAETPADKTFVFDAGKLTFDMAQSVARPTSLFNHFPLKLTGLVQQRATLAASSTSVTTPGDLGFISVAPPAGMHQSVPNDDWFGLVFDLNLGTLGALAGNLGFVVALLAAWQPGTAQSSTYIGLKLPGSKSANAEIPIEGILKLTFKRIEFVASDLDPADPGKGRAYVLKLRRIALSVFSASFPPGQTDLYLFGNPAAGDNNTLAWYAAYLKDKKKNA